MTTGRRSLLGRWLAVGLSIALVASTGHSETFKGPSYLLIQGGGLENPVVVHHGPAENWHPDRSDVLHLLGSPGEEVPEPQTPRYYEVYEFWPSATTPLPVADGTPSEPLDPAQADAVSRIYPDEPRGPAWNPYLQPFLAIQRMASDGAVPERPVRSPKEYRTISASGRELLESYGLTFASGGGDRDPELRSVGMKD